ncbi:Ldha [Symbiodinium sp. KB8]|nr:Ldha [Symbiodinium sp. KB8]
MLPVRRKVTVVGAGQVGVAVAYSIVNQGLCSELSLVDIAHDKVVGEALDLQHGSAFTKHVAVLGSSSYEISAGSDVVVITAGVRQREGESRLDLVGRNLSVLQSEASCQPLTIPVDSFSRWTLLALGLAEIVPQVVRYSPGCVILVVSNPCDIMTWLVYKLSGFPKNRVLGSGTALDSSRFRTLVGQRLGVSPRSVHGYIVGEHGDSSVACWSQLNVGGVPLKSRWPQLGDKDDPEAWYKVHEDVISAAGTVIRLKGYTSSGIGLTAASIVECILRNDRRVIPVSTAARGFYGITQDVFLSLPCVVGSNGVRDICSMPLDESEAAKLQASASTISKVQTPLKIEEAASASAATSAE